jgi:hypothetical protein
MTNKNGVVESMQFIVAPILRRDKDTIRLLLE